MREKTIGASYGDAFLAALAVGDVKPETIRAWNPVATEFTPKPANAEVYQRRYRVFRELYSRTKDLMRELDDEDSPTVAKRGDAPSPTGQGDRI